jgi:hypothetical protein
MIRVLLVAIAFLSVPAMAQTGPCSGCIQDPSIFALSLGSPVRVTFSDTVHAILSAPSVTIAGNEITVVQTEFETVVAPPASCNSQSVALGDLSSGSYTLTWKYQTLSNVSEEAFPFVFTVPEAAPCFLDINVLTRSPGQPGGQSVSIVYSAPYRGFLLPAAVAIDGNQIIIDQPAVIADPAFLGHVPCGRGVVQISSVRPGSYTISVRSNATGPLSASFVIAPPARGRAVRAH